MPAGKILRIDERRKMILIELESGAIPKPGTKIKFQTIRKNRTLNQNSLYWKFCEFVGDALYMTREEIHSGFAMANLGRVKRISGRNFQTIGSTTELSADEFGQYLDRCNLTALEFGVDTGAFWEEYEQWKK